MATRTVKFLQYSKCWLAMKMNTFTERYFYNVLTMYSHLITIVFLLFLFFLFVYFFFFCNLLLAIAGSRGLYSASVFTFYFWFHMNLYILITHRHSIHIIFSLRMIISALGVQERPSMGVRMSLLSNKCFYMFTITELQTWYLLPG